MGFANNEMDFSASMRIIGALILSSSGKFGASEYIPCQVILKFSYQRCLEVCQNGPAMTDIAHIYGSN